MGHGGFCNAATRSGGNCGRTAGWGTGHPGVGACKQHGGSTPTHELAGALAIARSEATVMGNPLAIEPHEAILQCIRIAAGEVRYASDRIAELQDSEVVGPVETRKERPLSLGKEGEDPDVPVQEVTAGPPALHIWVETRHRAMDRLVNFSKVALAAGVEERRVKAAEQWAAGYVELVKRLLEDLGHDLNAPGTREVVVKHLRLLDGGQGVTG